MEYYIEIGYIDGVKDALGDVVIKDIEDLGIKNVESVKTELLYRIDGNLDEKNVNIICRDLLSDPVIQWYRVNDKKDSREKSDGKKSSADVFYKNGVTDAVGESVKLGIRDLGIDGTRSVKTGVRYRFTGELSDKDIEKICRSLLANSVIQDYSVGVSACQKC